jgi:hypothetical protein
LSRGLPADPSCDDYRPESLDLSWLAETPALLVAWQREAMGEGAARMDNRPAITASITAHNQEVRQAMARVAKSGGCSIGGVGGGGALALLSLIRGLMARRRFRSRSAR